MNKTNVSITLIVIFMISFFVWLPEPESVKEPLKSQTKLERINVISKVTLFNGEDWSDNVDVAFANGLILEVGNALEKKYSNVNLIDGKNQFLIPGLIDGHTHAWGNALKEAVKFGVTTELDMFTNNAFAIPQRDQREKHQENIQQADLFSAGTLITSPKGHGTEYGFEIPTINNPDEAEKFIEGRVNEGSDYIKIVYNSTNRYMPSIDRETLNAVVKAAHNQSKLAIVHISDYESALHAAEAGADGLVHSFMERVDMSLMSTLTNLMHQKSQFVIPTLSVLSSMAGQDSTSELVHDFEQHDIEVSAQKIQLTQRIGQLAKNELFNQAIDNVRALFNAGVLIIAGTDAPNTGTAHGISLHGELELLVQSGLSPTQALKAATANPSIAFKLSNRGYIRKGMKADLLLLNKDPRVNIRNTRTIAAVYKNGFLITEEKKQSLNRSIKVATNLGNFDQDLKSSLSSPQFYSEWIVTTDEMFKGNSSAQLKRIESDADPYLQIIGEIGKQFSFPWAGVYLVLSQDDKLGLNISSMKSIDFKTRGLAGNYRLLLFSTKQQMRPIEISFTVSNDWNQINLALQQVPQVLLESITGLAIVAGPEQTEFELNIDDVWLR